MKNKKFVTIKRYGVFINELPNNEYLIHEWILKNVPPLHDIRNSTRSAGISEMVSFYEAREIAAKKGYKFELSK